MKDEEFLERELHGKRIFSPRLREKRERERKKRRRRRREGKIWIAKERITCPPIMMDGWGGMNKCLRDTDSRLNLFFCTKEGGWILISSNFSDRIVEKNFPLALRRTTPTECYRNMMKKIVFTRHRYRCGLIHY